MIAAKLTRWMFGLALAAAAMVLVLAQAARAQEAAGVWHGGLTSPSGEFRLEVRIAPDPGGGLGGSLVSVDQSNRAIPLADVRAEAGELRFAAPSISTRYEGRWDAGRGAWVGTFTQGSPQPLVLMAGKVPAAPVVAGLDGRWEGALAAGAAKLQLVLRVRTGEWGTLGGLDSPDQLAYGLKLANLANAGGKVSFDVPSVLGRFEGTLAPDGQSIAGQWTQGGRPLVLTLTKAAAVAAARPQTPKPPFPYRTEEVSVPSAAGVTLAGTLTVPPGPGPFPAAVLITGSGPQDRDETIMGHKPFAVLADDLTRRGVAVLRYDDRGFGKSTGDFGQATTVDFAADARAALAFLRTRAEIDGRRLGLIGHSEGGIVAPIAAGKEPGLAFVVLIAGSGVPSREMMVAQRDAVSRTMVGDAAAAGRNQVLMTRVDEAMATAPSPEAALAEATRLMSGAPGLSPAAADAQAREVSSPWYRFFIAYDPRPALEALRMPVLAVNGSKDTQVVASQNLPAIRRALRGDRQATVMELPGLNHLLQTADTGGPGEYARIEETLAPSALKVIGEWIVARTRPAAGKSD